LTAVESADLTYHFGEFELDVRAYELRRRGRPVRLARQPMDLLLILLDRPRELVTREQIVPCLWGQGVHTDVDAGMRVDDHVLVVNEVGEHLMLSPTIFDAFVSHRLTQTVNPYQDLKAGHFLFDGNADTPTRLLATKYRTKRDYLRDFTKLHIFVVSLRCDHSCEYCQVSRVSADKTLFDMSYETAERALDLVFRSPAEYVKIEFQGGEPLLNFERIRHIVESCRATVLLIPIRH
jgi:uncharacterized radical SAM superfamily Fe-S cluster-containing enzyme